MIQISTNAGNTAATRAATPPGTATGLSPSQPATCTPQPESPPASAPPASQPATTNLQLGTARAAGSQPSTLNPQPAPPCFPQATRHWPLATEPKPTALARFRSGSFSLTPRFSAVPAGDGMEQPFQRLPPSLCLSCRFDCAPQNIVPNGAKTGRFMPNRATVFL